MKRLQNAMSEVKFALLLSSQVHNSYRKFSSKFRHFMNVSCPQWRSQDFPTGGGGGGGGRAKPIVEKFSKILAFVCTLNGHNQGYRLCVVAYRPTNTLRYQFFHFIYILFHFFFALLSMAPGAYPLSYVSACPNVMLQNNYLLLQYIKIRTYLKLLNLLMIYSLGVELRAVSFYIGGALHLHR